MFCGRGFICGSHYAEVHLRANDYYEKGKSVKGVWMGNACGGFGVNAGDEVQDAEFAALSEGFSTEGLQLRNRNNEGPKHAGDGSILAKGRRSFYDLTLNAPKSFSIMAVTMGDRRIREWHSQAVLRTFARIEKMASRRVHEGGSDESLKRTASIACARYAHDANRALDPQLHDHLVVFNMTPDADDGKNYAVESNEWFRSSACFTAVYRDELASQALRGGYDLEFDSDGAPQIRGMNDLVKEFSSRSNEIEFLIKECEDNFGVILSTRMRKQITYASRGFDQAKFNKKWSSIGYGSGWSKGRRVVEFLHLVRACSDGGLKEATTEAVIDAQKERIGEERLQLLERTISQAKTKESAGVIGMADGRELRAPEAALDLATRCVFARASVETPENLAARAIEASCGAGQYAEVESLVDSCAGGLLKLGGNLTTQENAERELRIVEAMLDGTGKLAALNTEFAPDKRLEDEQRVAVEGFAKSRDFIVSLIGDAGTGKTFTTAEMVRAAVEGGNRVFLCAPSNGARDVLRRDGEGMANASVAKPFLKAESLQMLLANEKLRNSLPAGSLVVLDEAGLASVKMLSDLVAEGREKGWRFLFVGDPKQHVAVEAGDAFRAMLASGFGRTWHLEKIRRQRPDALDGAYQKAAGLFASGHVEEAFSLLDSKGAIHELRGRARIDAIAARYVELSMAGKSVIAVNPTHRENDAVSEAIRSILKARGIIDGTDARAIEVFEPSQATEAELERRELFKTGVHLLKVRGEGVGREHLTIIGDAGGGAFLAKGDDGSERRLHYAGDYAICSRREIEVCPGDKLMVGTNVKGKEGGFVNGEIVTVSGFDAKGRIIVDDGRILDARILSYGYASTSHKSQGSTCDAVLLGIDARSAANFADMKLAYVGATRGRESIDVYCEDKSLLYEIGFRSGDRILALEGMSSGAKRFCSGLLELADRLSKAIKDAIPFRRLKEKAIRHVFFNSKTARVKTPHLEPKFQPFHRPEIATSAKHARRI